MKLRRIVKWTLLLLLAVVCYLPVIEMVSSGETDPKALLYKTSFATIILVMILGIFGFLGWALNRITKGKTYSSPPLDLPQNAFQVRISMFRMNVMSVLITAVSMVVVFDAHRALWGDLEGSPVRFLPYLLLLVVLHELSHAIGWVVCGMPIRKVKFGVLWHLLAPYAHCSVPTSMAVYRFTILLPLLTTGFLPLGTGLYMGDLTLALASAILIGGAAGDISTTLAGIAFHRRVLVMDHPSAPAFIILNKGNI